jgi:hypothetical protein
MHRPLEGAVKKGDGLYEMYPPFTALTVFGNVSHQL